MADPEAHRAFPGESSHTLAICTYNRARSLERTLRSLEEALEASGDHKWEILVIDNNSTDDTASVCSSHSSLLPLRHVFEARQGLSHARNRALAESTGELLVFTDDDVVVDRKWLAQYATCRTRFPDAGFFGGKIKPLWSRPPPAWLKDQNMALFSGLLVHYDIGTEDRWLESDDPTPFGASFAVTKDLSDLVGQFRPDLGVKGAVPGRGEEADYLARAGSAGFRGAYLASAVCYHPVDRRRLSLRYLYLYGVQKGIAEIRMRRAGSRGSVKREIVYALRGLYQLARGHGDRFRQCVINMGIQRGLRGQQS